LAWFVFQDWGQAGGVKKKKGGGQWKAGATKSFSWWFVKKKRGESGALHDQKDASIIKSL